MRNMFLKMNLKQLSFLLILCCGAATAESGIPLNDGGNKPARPVKTFTVGELQDTSYHYYPAKVRSGQRVKLAFQVTGQIIRFPVKSGQQVKKGDILGELNSHDYENALKSVIANYRESKTDFERYSQLVRKQAVSVAVFEAKRKGYEVAEAEMKIAEKALADTKLLSPFDGVVAATYVDNFQNIQAKQEILSLQGNSDIELVINVPEKEVIKMPANIPPEKVGEHLRPTAVFPALKNLTFPLKIKEFETEADSATQTYQGVLTMPASKEYSIMPGMTALVRVRIDRDSGAETGYPVPVMSVGQDADGNAYVWIVDRQMVARKRPVTVGSIEGDRILIKSGVTHGETIIAAGVGFVHEGMKVKKLDHIGGRAIREVSGDCK